MNCFLNDQKGVDKLRRQEQIRRNTEGDGAMSGYRDRLGGKTWIAAHRGIAGGNIPCNSIAGYEASILQGADVLEVDISISLDGTLYVFHPKKEPLFLRSQKFIPQMHDEEIDALELVNSDGARSGEHVPRLDACLERFGSRCVLNVDKFWTDIPRIAAAIRRCGMQDQVIVKAPLKPEYLRQIEEYAPDMPFMPLIREDEGTHETLLANPRIRYIGAEVLFKKDTSPLASRAFIDRVHRDGCVLWVNPIIYDPKEQLVAGRSDDRAITGDPDGSWGWLIERGFDILQTDWPLAMRLYGMAKYLQRFDALERYQKK